MTEATHAGAPAELIEATKRYREATALERVTLALEPGRVTAVLGPNGAGKTTAVRLLLGLAAPTSGAARLFGRNPREPSSRRRAGAMLQVAKVPETLRVVEHLHLFASYYPRPLPIARLVEIAGLGGLERRRFGELSGGQQRRVLFALALAGDPDLLFLDEPTVGLDVESRRALWTEVRALADEGRSIVLTTHYLEEADALADRVVVLERGRILADGTPAEIKRRVAGRRIRCVTSVADDRLAALPGVRSVARDRDAVVLLASSAEEALRELFALDPALSDLEVTGVGLEEAFLALTGTAPLAAGVAR
jgi:ABC-2 type transport system ATP-binding protein